MKIGVAAFCTDETLSPAQLAVELEQRGFESLFITDHTHIPVSRVSDYPDVYGGGELPEFYKRTHDVFVALSFAAAATSTLNLASGVCLVGQRDPIVTAKAVASLDALSGGRLAAFGVGFGWNRDELEAHGTDFKRRREVTRDRVAVCASCGPRRSRASMASTPGSLRVGPGRSHEPAADLPGWRRADDDAARGRVGRRVVPRQPHR